MCFDKKIINTLIFALKSFRKQTKDEQQPPPQVRTDHQCQHTSQDKKDKKKILKQNRHTATQRLLRFPNRVPLFWVNNDEDNKKAELKASHMVYVVMTHKNIRKFLRSYLAKLGCRGQSGHPLQSIEEELSKLSKLVPKTLSVYPTYFQTANLLFVVLAEIKKP